MQRLRSPRGSQRGNVPEPRSGCATDAPSELQALGATEGVPRWSADGEGSSEGTAVGSAAQGSAVAEGSTVGSFAEGPAVTLVLRLLSKAQFDFCRVRATVVSRQLQGTLVGANWSFPGVW